MASKKPAAEKPAAKPADRKPAVKPAAKSDAPGVGIHELAAELGTEDLSGVRARIRRIKGGAQVGQGGRYRWDSKADPEYKELLAALKGTPKEKVKK